MACFLLRGGCTHTVVSGNCPVQSGINTTQLLMQKAKRHQNNSTFPSTGPDLSSPGGIRVTHSMHIAINLHARESLLQEMFSLCNSAYMWVTHSLDLCSTAWLIQYWPARQWVWLHGTHVAWFHTHTHHMYTNSCVCIILQHILYSYMCGEVWLRIGKHISVAF